MPDPSLIERNMNMAQKITYCVASLLKASQEHLAFAFLHNNLIRWRGGAIWRYDCKDREGFQQTHGGTVARIMAEQRT